MRIYVDGLLDLVDNDEWGFMYDQLPLVMLNKQF